MDALEWHGEDSFGGRKKRKRRRKKRRARIKRKLKGGLKKIGRGVKKGLKKVVTSKVFKKILSVVPVYGQAAVAAINAGTKIARAIKGKVRKASGKLTAAAELKARLPRMKGKRKAIAVRKVRALAASGRSDISRAAKGLTVAAKMENRARKMVAVGLRAQSMRARAGDPRATVAVAKARQVGKAALLDQARAKLERKIVARAPSSQGYRVVLPGGEVVVIPRSQVEV